MSGYITPKSASAPAPVTPPKPLSRAAARSLWFALAIILANVVINTVTLAYAGAGAPAGLAWTVLIAHAVIVLALFGFALAAGVTGLRETAGGALRGRGRAIAGIVVGGALVLITIGGGLLRLALSFLG